MKKRLLSILLTLALMTALAPASVLPVYAASGKCGEHLRWSYDAGILTITGKGPMADYDAEENRPPWHGFAGDITELRLPDGLTSVGAIAFWDCVSLEKVTLPDSVKRIENCGFSGCSALTDVRLPEGLTHIGEYAFSFCQSMTDPGLPESTRHISGHAYQGCLKLERVTIPAGVSEIGPGVFGECLSLTEIEVAPGSEYYTDVDGVLFTRDKKELIEYPCARTGSYQIPDGVTRIAEEAFTDCEHLREVTTPDTLTSIGACAFYNCWVLMNISLGRGVKSIEEMAFDRAGFAGLENNWIDGLLYADDWLIWARVDLKTAVIRDGTRGVAMCAFRDCENLVSVTLPDSLEFVCASAFEGCAALERLILPQNVAEVGVSAFYGCAGLKQAAVMNPDCAVDSTDGMTLGHPGTTQILGYPGSTAQAYAKKYGYVFKALSKDAGFADVSARAFYAEAVAWAVKQGITNGTSKETFSPEDTCTRGQVVTFLWRAHGSRAPINGQTGFTDVDEKAFYAKAVAWAVENKITSGTSKTTFSPGAGCTRAQVVTFLWRAAGCPAPKTADNPFTDVKPGAFYDRAVAWAVEQGITNGTGPNTFSPEDTCTRGQIVTFLWRDMQRK